MTVLDLTAADYHADDIGSDRSALSASIAHILCTRSPLHAWVQHPRLNPDFKRTEEDKFDRGTAAHAYLLENELPVIVDAPDWRTKAAKEQREAARALGQTALLEHQWGAVQQMLKAVYAQLETIEVEPRPFTDGRAEQTIVWDEDGVLCKARLDWIRDDLRAYDNLKTTAASADPQAFEKRIYDQGADLSAAFYLRGCRAVYGQDVPLRWIVVESAPPFGLSVVYPGADVLALGDAKVDYALRVWRDCLANDEWPCYSTAAVEAQMPPWEEAKWMERMAREEVAA